MRQVLYSAARARAPKKEAEKKMHRSGPHPIKGASARAGQKKSLSTCQAVGSPPIASPALSTCQSSRQLPDMCR